jgi:hypothetical protein
MPTGSRNLDCHPGERLSPHVRQIGLRTTGLDWCGARSDSVSELWPGRAAVQGLDQFAEAPSSTNLDVGHEGALSVRGRRHNGRIGLHRCDERQDSGDTPHRAVEPELADESALVNLLGGKLPDRYEHSHSDRQIEPGASFSETRWRQVHRHAT